MVDTVNGQVGVSALKHVLVEYNIELVYVIHLLQVMVEKIVLCLGELPNPKYAILNHVHQVNHDILSQ